MVFAVGRTAHSSPTRPYPNSTVVPFTELASSGVAVGSGVAAGVEVGVDVSVGVGEETSEATALWDSEKAANIKLITNMATIMPIFDRCLCVVRVFSHPFDSLKVKGS